MSMDIPYPSIGSVDHDDQEHPLGVTSESPSDENDLYMYVKIVDADVADGDALDVAQFRDADDNFKPHLTKDRSGGSSNGQTAAAVAVNAISQGNFGWVKVKGPHGSIQTETGSGTDLAVGDMITTDPSNDGSAAAVDADGEPALAETMAASATGDSSVEAMINTIFA